MATATTPTAAAPTKIAGGARRRGAKFRAAPYAILPSLLLTFVFVYGFIAFNEWISLSSWRRPTRRNLSLRKPFAATYRELFGEQRFQADLRNMIVFSVGFLLVAVLGGLVTA